MEDNLYDKYDELQTELVKLRRSYEDMIYNLDEDNFPNFSKKISYITEHSEAYASITGRIDNAESSIEILTSWKSSASTSIDNLGNSVDTINSSISTIQSTVDAQGASITVLNNWKSTASDNITVLQNNVSSLSSTADSQGAKISAIVSSTSDGYVANASFIISAINGQSAAKISADLIEFTGTSTFLTAEDVSSTGSTTIYGGRITSGELVSDNYSESSGSVTAGMKIGLTDGTISSPSFNVNSSGIVSMNINNKFMVSPFGAVSAWQYGICDSSGDATGMIIGNGTSSQSNLQFVYNDGVLVNKGGSVYIVETNSGGEINIGRYNMDLSGTISSVGCYIYIGNTYSNVTIVASTVDIQGTVKINGVVQ